MVLGVEQQAEGMELSERSEAPNCDYVIPLLSLKVHQFSSRRGDCLCTPPRLAALDSLQVLKYVALLFVWQLACLRDVDHFFGAVFCLLSWLLQVVRTVVRSCQDGVCWDHNGGGVLRSGRVEDSKRVHRARELLRYPLSSFFATAFVLQCVLKPPMRAVSGPRRILWVG